MSLNVFWDNSNIWLVGKKVCSQNEPGHEADFRIDFAKLMSAVVAGRQPEFAYVAGSLPPSTDSLWGYFSKLGAVVDKQERGAIGGKEVAVDQAIQHRMLQRAFDADKPGTMLLLTGDGNGHLEGKGFIPELQRVKRAGWAIEVVSWDAGCNPALRTFAQQNGKYISLEPFYYNVTYIEKGRRAK